MLHRAHVSEPIDMSVTEGEWGYTTSHISEETVVMDLTQFLVKTDSSGVRDCDFC